MAKAKSTIRNIYNKSKKIYIVCVDYMVTVYSKREFVTDNVYVIKVPGTIFEYLEYKMKTNLSFGGMSHNTVLCPGLEELFQL